MTYRTATLTPPVAPEAPPWWQRLLFRIDRTAAAERWQWARQAIGGRWSRVGEFNQSGDFGDWLVRHYECATKAGEMGFPSEVSVIDAISIRDYGTFRWRRFDACPGKNRRNIHGVWDIRGECHAERCVCEVWP